MANLAEVALFTDRVDEMAAFYEKVIGSAPVYRGKGIAVFKEAGVTILIHNKSASQPGGPPNENHIALAVSDVDAVCSALEKQGLTVLVPPRDHSWGKAAYLRDPDGQLVELQNRQ